MASLKNLSPSEEQIILKTATIAQDLSDPRAPKICPLCLHDVLETVIVPQMALLSKLSHDFWDAVVRFVALKRSDVEIALLEDNLTILLRRCPFHTRHITKPYNDMNQSLVQIVLDVMLEDIFNVLNGPEPNAESSMKRAHSERRAFGTASGNWPQKPGQLLPYGAESSLQAYISWAADPLLPWALLTISSLNVAVYPMVAPALVANPALKLLLARAISRPLVYPRTIEAWKASPGSRDRPPPDCIARDGAFSVLTGLHLDPYSTPAFRHAFAGDGVAEILFPALCDFVIRAGNLPGDSTRVAGLWLAVTYDALPAEIIRSNIPVQIQMMIAAYKQHFIGQETVADLCYKALRAWDALRKCSAAHCTTQLMTLEGTVPLLRCIQCKTARYCSRNCQRVDWKDGKSNGHGIPHKELCPAVTAARLFGGFDSTLSKPQPEFAAAFETGGALEPYSNILVRWTRGSGMLQSPQVEHLNALLSSASDVKAR